MASSPLLPFAHADDTYRAEKGGEPLKDACLSPTTGTTNRRKYSLRAAVLLPHNLSPSQRPMTYSGQRRGRHCPSWGGGEGKHKYDTFSRHQSTRSLT